MTEAEARCTLSKKLVFGNVDQIAAVKFLAAIEECAEVLLTCDHYMSMFWGCPCTSRFSDEVIAAARRRV